MCWSVSGLCLTLGVCVIYYYIILLLYYYILLLLYLIHILYYYTIISYTILLFCSFPPFHISSSQSFLIYLQFYSPSQSIYLPPLLQFSSQSFPRFILYLSVLTYTYLYSLSISLPNPNIWPRTNYRRDVSSGVVLFVWCSVLVFWLRCDVVISRCSFMFWAGGWLLTLGVILYITIISYTIIICILYYYYIILYITIIIYYTLPSSHSLFLPIFLFLPILSSFPLYSNIPSPPLQSSSSILPFPQYSFYTCRYLHILIYIPSFPNKLSINIKRNTHLLSIYQY
jgi:hypothetical protein